MILLLIIFALIVLVIFWFNIPYSPFRNRFKKDLTKQTQLSESFLREASNAVYAKEDFKSLPPLIQTYLEECGYIGSPRKSILQMEYKKNYEKIYMGGKIQGFKKCVQAAPSLETYSIDI